MIEVKNISFKYATDWVIRDVKFSLKEGEKVALFGVNGSGKSSLLKLLDGLLFPQKGEILFRETPLTRSRLKHKAFRKVFRSSVALLFQNPDVMLFNPTVYDELAFGLRQMGENDVEEKIRYWADKLKLSGLLHQSPLKLSGGEKQRAALASVLITEPALLLLDEPFASLDPKATGWLIDFLHSLEASFVVALHNIELSREIARRVIVLSEDHKIIFDGDMETFAGNQDIWVEAGLWHRHSGKAPHVHNF